MNKIIFCLGLFFCLFPLASRVMERQHQEDVLATYEENVSGREQKELAECIEDAGKYNQMLYQMKGILMQNAGKLPEDNGYEQQLNLFGNGIMGSIQIPKIKVSLPIYHGTAEQVLSVGAGHLEESSLPVGGMNTHSVLTGHRGLPNSQLFTRLDELEEGDLFFIHIYKWTMAYKVCEIKVVSPENREILEIREGEDKVSLVTCTPYGINTHRLVVTGRRVTYEKADYTEGEAARMSWRELLFAALPFLFIGIALAGYGTQRRKRRMEQREQQRKQRRKRKRRAKGIRLLFLCLLMWTAPVAAAETEKAAGRIEIRLTDGEEGTSKEHVRFAYAKVGEIENGIPVLSEAYKKSGVELEQVMYAEELEKAAGTIQKYVKNRSLVTTDSDGKAVIEDLEEGVYLLELFDQAAYETVRPMLVTMPVWDEAEKRMNYDITVIPKHSRGQETPETGDTGGELYRGILLAVAAMAVISFHILSFRKNL